MSNKKQFYICSVCGNLVGMIDKKGPKIVCCGKPMNELIPNSSEASVEKHTPSVNITDDIVNVQVGSSIHPMTEEHHIAWVYILTNLGGQRKSLDINKEPVVSFKLIDGEKLMEVHSYCNLHGLWKLDI